jgi:ribosomal protein L20A (L18A)
MITIKTIRRINDSSVKRFREKGETFTVTPARLKEMESAIGDKFKLYFQIIKIEKVKEVEAPKTATTRKPRTTTKTNKNENNN